MGSSNIFTSTCALQTLVGNFGRYFDTSAELSDIAIMNTAENKAEPVSKGSHENQKPPQIQIKLSGQENKAEHEENLRLQKLSTTFSFEGERFFIYHGILLLNEQKEAMSDLANTMVRPDDVLLAGFLKSGTTWLTKILNLIMCDGEEKATQACHPKVPVIEFHCHLPLFQSHPSPRLMKTQLPFHLLPQQIHETGIKVVYILRNPKDMLVSMYHYLKDCVPKFIPGFKFTCSWDEFFLMFVHGYFPNGDWFNHILGWWDNRESPNILIVTYEDLKMNGVPTIRKISQFLGKQLSDEVIDNIMENTSFSKMKQNKLGLELTEKAGEMFFRKGDVGDWKNYFTVEQNDNIDCLLSKQIVDPALRKFIKFSCDAGK